MEKLSVGTRVSNRPHTLAEREMSPRFGRGIGRTHSGGRAVHVEEVGTCVDHVDVVEVWENLDLHRQKEVLGRACGHILMVSRGEHVVCSPGAKRVSWGRVDEAVVMSVVERDGDHIDMDDTELPLRRTIQPVLKWEARWDDRSYRSILPGDV
jgi:hypothetical protein